VEPRETEVGGLSIRVVALAPRPAGDTKPRPDEYRLTLSIGKKGLK
jgi:hypothetical protein